MYPYRHLLASGLFLAALPAQAPQSPLDRATRLVTAAEQRITDQDAVGATLLLWEAEAALDPRADDRASEAVAKSVARLLGRIDPLDGKRREARTAIAERIVKFTKRYTRKKWYRTSRDLLQWAASLDAEVAAKPLDYVVKKLDASADAKPRPSARAEKGEDKKQRPLLSQVQTLMVNGSWDYADGVLRSPEIAADETPVYLCSSPSLLDGEARVGLKIGPVEGAAALVFGVEGMENYFLAEIWQHGADGVSNISIYHFDFDGENRAAKLLAKSYVTADKTRAQRFATLALRVEGDTVRVTYDGSKPLKAKLPRRGVGGLGFLVPGNSPNKQPVEFRDLEVGPLTDEPSAGQPAAEDEPSPAQPVLDAITEAEGHFEARADEDGVFALRRAQKLLVRLESTTLRETLQEQVDALRTEHDPLAKAFGELEVAIAGDWGTLAGAYREAGRKRLAYELFRMAAEVDAETWGASTEDLEVELAASLAKERGLAAEAEQSAVSNDLLVECFEGSRQYWAREPWQLSEGGLRPPELGPDGAAMLLFDAPAGAGERTASVRVQQRDGLGSFGLIFGAKSAYELYALVVNYGAPDGEVVVWRLENGAWEEIERRKTRFSPEARAAWATLRVELLDGGKVRCQVGTDAAFECAVGGELPTRYGLFFGVHPQAKDSANGAFSGLRWSFGS